jgi:hypothetical protein
VEAEAKQVTEDATRLLASKLSRFGQRAKFQSAPHPVRLVDELDENEPSSDNPPNVN